MSEIKTRSRGIASDCPFGFDRKERMRSCVLTPFGMIKIYWTTRNIAKYRYSCPIFHEFFIVFQQHSLFFYGKTQNGEEDERFQAGYLSRHQGHRVSGRSPMLEWRNPVRGKEYYPL